MATAIGTPMTTAIADVTSVPNTSGHAPKIAREGFQSFENRNQRTP